MAGDSGRGDDQPRSLGDWGASLDSSALGRLGCRLRRRSGAMLCILRRCLLRREGSWVAKLQLSASQMRSFTPVLEWYVRTRTLIYSMHHALSLGVYLHARLLREALAAILARKGPTQHGKHGLTPRGTCTHFFLGSSSGRWVVEWRSLPLLSRKIMLQTTQT